MILIPYHNGKTMAVLSSLRLFDNPNQRFRDTSAESLIQYVMMMYGELRGKANQAATEDERQWYSDMAAIFLEIGCRYDELRPKAVPSNASER